ncbi:MAG: lysine 2,3-aminomutase [Myxococcales bacterium]|nr:lysine 2,3-aminomutase [Myxococcales bacterium]
MTKEPIKTRFFGIHDLERLPPLQALSPADRHAMAVVAHVLPFRTNNYVVEDLIDWSRVPDDPIFHLTFPQPGMLAPEHFRRMEAALAEGLGKAELKAVADRIRLEMNPHPAGQKALNVPKLDDAPVPGVQRKYRETALVFPARGQTCHAYCTFCFRWPQFVGLGDLKFATDESQRFAAFIKREKHLTDVLFTGGDPLVMRTEMLASYVDAILAPGFEHIRTVRFGTKSVSYWPQRFVSDPDADELLRLFERVVASGRHVAIMGHYNHPAELSTPVAREAVRRIRGTGAELRTQSPLIRHINDDPQVWAELWRTQVNLGCIPYYMFVERDTGAQRFFGVPLARAHQIYQAAFQQVSGLARTVRGPSMSAMPGKVAVDGVAEIRGEKVFVLSFLQGRNPDWVKRPFFARYNPRAMWLDDLDPAFDDERFFYEDELEDMAVRAHARAVVKLHPAHHEPVH